MYILQVRSDCIIQEDAELSIYRTAEGIPSAELDLIMLWIAAEC